MHRSKKKGLLFDHFVRTGEHIADMRVHDPAVRGMVFYEARRRLSC
jgi:hypothetical protein